MCQAVWVLAVAITAASCATLSLPARGAAESEDGYSSLSGSAGSSLMP